MGELILITGGSASGKSEYGEYSALEHISHTAENRSQSSSLNELFYIAAMCPADEESRERILRHRNMRCGKGFETIECYTGLTGLLNKIPPDCTALLECMSNLLANEMYKEEGALRDVPKGKTGREEELRLGADECIIAPVLRLSDLARRFIVITNDIFLDGNEYSAETEEYINLLGYINRRLAERADSVIRVVSSIPVVLK